MFVLCIFPYNYRLFKIPFIDMSKKKLTGLTLHCDKRLLKKNSFNGCGSVLSYITHLRIKSLFHYN